MGKKEVYDKWDPASPRSAKNFNPFETYKGNSCDASGIFPGESRYKDPIRGDVSFAIMMEEKAEAEEREKNPKAGSEPGCPGCITKISCYLPHKPFTWVLKLNRSYE